MTTSEPSGLSLQRTKEAAIASCSLFVNAVIVSPRPSGGLGGIGIIVFLSTWGLMLVSAFFSIGGYFACKRRAEQIGIFYFICPALLFIAFLVFLGLEDIVGAIISYGRSAA
jgi:hypothetical protein